MHRSRKAASRRASGLQQVKAGVDDSGPGLSALGLCWCARSGPVGSGAFGHSNGSYWPPRPSEGKVAVGLTTVILGARFHACK